MSCRVQEHGIVVCSQLTGDGVKPAHRVSSGELREAVRTAEIADLDADLAAFQIDAVLTATNIALRLGDTDAAGKARRVVDGFLTPLR